MDFSGIPKESPRDTPTKGNRFPNNIKHYNSNPLNAFKTSLNKTNRYKVKTDRQDYFPESNPEFTRTDTLHFRKKNRESEYREVMVLQAFLMKKARLEGSRK